MYIYIRYFKHKHSDLSSINIHRFNKTSNGVNETSNQIKLCEFHIKHCSQLESNLPGCKHWNNPLTHWHNVHNKFGKEQSREPESKILQRKIKQRYNLIRINSIVQHNTDITRKKWFQDILKIFNVSKFLKPYKRFHREKTASQVMYTRLHSFQCNLPNPQTMC